MRTSISIVTTLDRLWQNIFSFFLCLLMIYSSYQTDEYDGYYDNTDLTATDITLKTNLQSLIQNHTVISYDDIWLTFITIDQNLPTYPCNLENSTYIPDVYSSYCWDPEKITPGGECGNYAKEGDCYNREHLWPKSWFGGFDEGQNAQTDLFELWPTDGYVNGLRGNYPLGNVLSTNIKYTSTNGCKIGICDTNSEDYSGYCFEPADIYKGDFARSYFYLSVSYMDQWACCDTDGVNGSSIKPWMESILRTWHASDTVDAYEMARNEVIYTNYQHNRNPFIDYPELVDQISDF